MSVGTELRARLLAAARLHRRKQLCPRCGEGEVTSASGFCRECMDVRAALARRDWEETQ